MNLLRAFSSAGTHCQAAPGDWEFQADSSCCWASRELASTTHSPCPCAVRGRTLTILTSWDSAPRVRPKIVAADSGSWAEWRSTSLRSPLLAANWCLVTCLLVLYMARLRVLEQLLSWRSRAAFSCRSCCTCWLASSSAASTDASSVPTRAPTRVACSALCCATRLTSSTAAEVVLICCCRARWACSALSALSEDSWRSACRVAITSARVGSVPLPGCALCGRRGA